MYTPRGGGRGGRGVGGRSGGGRGVGGRSDGGGTQGGDVQGGEDSSDADSESDAGGDSGLAQPAGNVDAELPPWHEQLGHADLRARERELREARGLSVLDLAEKAGLRSGDVANLENGRTFPVPESTLIALEDVLGEALPRPGPTSPLCDKEPLCWHRSDGESNRTLYVYIF